MNANDPDIVMYQYITTGIHIYKFNMKSIFKLKIKAITILKSIKIPPKYYKRKK